MLCPLAEELVDSKPFGVQDQTPLCRGSLPACTQHTAQLPLQLTPGSAPGYAKRESLLLSRLVW